MDKIDHLMAENNKNNKEGQKGQVTPKKYLKKPQHKTDFFLKLIRAQNLRLTAAVQLEMIISCLSEILLKAADGEKTIFAIPGPDVCFESNPNYGVDGITEKVSF